MLPGDHRLWKLQLEPSPPPEKVDRSIILAKLRDQWREAELKRELTELNQDGDVEWPELDKSPGWQYKHYL